MALLQELFVAVIFVAFHGRILHCALPGDAGPLAFFLRVTHIQHK